MPLPIKFIKTVASALEDKEKTDKAKQAKKSKPKANNMIDCMELIRQDVEANLGKYAKEYQLITNIEIFRSYIQKANNYGFIAIDTETTGLNPLVDQIVGLCLYFPGEKATYVPINHVDYFSDTRIEEQLNENQVKEILEELTANVIYHNAQFDIRVIKNQIGVYIPCYWDTLLAATLLNENELHGLKYLHGKYISGEDEKTFSDLFGKIKFKDVPISYAYLYAAHDAIDTFELYKLQLETLNENDDPNLWWLYRNIEIPMIDVIVDLEDRGVAVDIDYLDSLKEKYHKNLDDALKICDEETHKYIDIIDAYNASHINKPLDVPINVGSSSQLAILFYDILGAKPLADKKARCTDVDVMEAWKDKYPIAKAILDYRAAQKITSTYVDNIYDIIHTDNRVHTHFHSMGARTGRMSSSDPLNLQNIPSHNEDIRKMFVGQTTYRDVEKRHDGAYIFNRCEEVQLADDSWKFVEQLVAGDKLKDGEVVRVIKVKELKVLLGVE